MKRTRGLLFAPLLVLLLLPGCFKTRQEIAREKEESELRTTLQQNVVEYGGSIEKLQGELGRLQGRLEELEHQRKKELGSLLSGQSSDQKAIEELRGRLATLQEGQKALFEEIKKLREEGIAAASARPAPPAAPAVKKKPAAGEGGFEAALSSYRSGDFAAAEEGFRAYLRASPRGRRALDARYHLADSLYKQKKFESAVTEFGLVQERASTGGMGRRSALRIAQSFQALGKTRDARTFAQLLIDSSPGSEEARAARKLLK